MLLLPDTLPVRASLSPTHCLGLAGYLGYGAERGHAARVLGHSRLEGGHGLTRTFRKDKLLAQLNVGSASGYSHVSFGLVSS